MLIPSERVRIIKLDIVLLVPIVHKWSRCCFLYFVCIIMVDVFCCCFVVVVIVVVTYCVQE